MKIAKLVLILFIVVISFFSCEENNPILNGTWLGAYSYSSEEAIKSPIRNVMVFTDSEFIQKGFKYDGYKDERRLFNGSIKELLLNKTEESGVTFWDVIYSVTSDSLIFETVDENRNNFGNKQVYKRLEDSLKTKKNCSVDLIGKKFIIESETYNDTVFFKNDSLLLKSSNKLENSFFHWCIVNINGFKIIFMDNDVPYVLYCNGDKNSLEAVAVFDQFYHLKLREILKN